MIKFIKLICAFILTLTIIVGVSLSAVLIPWVFIGLLVFALFLAKKNN